MSGIVSSFNIPVEKRNSSLITTRAVRLVLYFHASKTSFRVFWLAAKWTEDIGDLWSDGVPCENSFSRGFGDF
jgi:hypothetical protein